MKNKIADLRNRGVYDSAIVCQGKALEIAVRLKDSSYVQYGYFMQYQNYKKVGNKDFTAKYLQKWYDMSEMRNDTLWMASAKQIQGTILYNNEEYEEAFEKYSTSKKLYLEINDTINAGKLLLNIANLQKKIGNLGASQLSALDGLQYLESTNNLKSLSGLYYALAVASKETGRLKIAEQRLNQALAMAKDSASRSKIGILNIRKFKNTKANIFKELEQYDKAIIIYEELLVDEKNDTLETKRVNANLAHTLFLKNGFNKKSDSLLQNALSYFFSIKKTSALFSVQLKLAQLYSEINESKSLKYAIEALKNAKKTGNPTSVFEALEVKIHIKHEDGDFTNYVKIRKQIEVNKENLSYLYANERFDLDTSEKKRIASDKAKIISDKNAAQARNQNLILLLILLILLVVTFFIYQKIKRRHKVEKIKTAQATEVRIATKVHDELANDIHNLMSRLETSDPDKDNVLDKLDIIYNNARDISKQNSSVETGKNFPEELSNLFRSYQSEEVNVILKKYDIDIWKGISSHIKITIYRVLQELLTNTKKHSNAALVMVSVEKKNKELFIQYTDNGKGFDEEISKNGLQNAENRIHAIKGKLTFDTELHNGCKFNINVPV
ncbi:ATP-binding protein [Kordia antarctica]|uniref:ATP-binding protein n=1 Tax=Kordia antarctica TaxID=1218801 RepID=UPI0013596A91|nr:ATP-binding protein [Kordia antarctica]